MGASLLEKEERGQEDIRLRFILQVMIIQEYIRALMHILMI